MVWLTPDEQVAVAPFEVAQNGVEGVRSVRHDHDLVAFCTNELRHRFAIDTCLSTTRARDDIRVGRYTHRALSSKALKVSR